MGWEMMWQETTGFMRWWAQGGGAWASRWCRVGDRMAGLMEGSGWHRQDCVEWETMGKERVRGCGVRGEGERLTVEGAHGRA